MAGIYIHIPFCKQACYYCDFHFSTSLKYKNEVLKGIEKELVLRKNEIGSTKIETIYFGGGTPSLLSLSELNSIFEVIYKNFSVVASAEITLEANPDDLSSEKIKELAKSPVNRLSIGIQSFFDDDLKFMNRAHNASESKKCLEEALKYFDNITIDLIYGVPNMTSEKWKSNLQQAFDFGVPHISSYALTVEEKTALHNFIKKGKVPGVDEGVALEHFNMLVQETEKKGFVQYEISNFGKPNYFSKHNTSYWLGKPYLGVGPSAHSFNGTQRAWNISNNIKYVNALKENKLPLEIESLSENEQFNELVMTGLRTIWGVDLLKVKEHFDTSYFTYLSENSKSFIEQGLLEINAENCLVTTKKGKFLADGIASDLFKV
ncbi:oxygen-independent coproporphyrinogen-3 oxidase [Lutibacter oricola]|uniref:Heme chaperone HemW n=1 Tax=Lutibacter oricola TaxID=762486 RepID=A0A1H2U312_9FLAO|nr:radical SAM family heme chaperone HemW [Lutibacter oricola]SDW50400.1 oxygen-independent coproporphyrinogen-3 oxidase [Lutibacter oricola]